MQPQSKDLFNGHHMYCFDSPEAPFLQVELGGNPERGASRGSHICPRSHLSFIAIVGRGSLHALRTECISELQEMRSVVDLVYSYPFIQDRST